jgi:tRNA 2-thiouridine synthesizing protein C
MPMPRRILFLISHAPRRGALAAEMLDELLIGAAFEQAVSVLFIGDGAYQIVEGDDPAGGSVRTYRALPTYDVHDVFVERAALKPRGLEPDRFVIGARPLARPAIRRLVAAQDVVVSD